MDVADIVSKLNETQVLETDNSLSTALPGNRAKEHKESNDNKREQMEIEVRDMISLFPLQTPDQTHVLAKDSFSNGGGSVVDPTEEDQEANARITTNQQTQTGLSRMIVSRSAIQTTTSQIETRATDLKIGFKVSCWVTAISATGIISVLVGYLGNHTTNLTHKLLFKACMVSMCGSFLSGLCLFVLTITHPNFQGLIPTVKIITWIAMGLMALTVGLGTCILLWMD